MNENIELLEYIYENAEMGVYTTTCLINKLENKENKIKHVLESELKEYEKHMSESQKILQRNDVEPNGSNMMIKMSSDIGITIETIKDNSDVAMAQMLIQGMTMGTTDIESKIKKYKLTCDKSIIKMAKKYLKFQENEIEKLKSFM